MAHHAKVRRKWTSFDRTATNAEFLTIPQPNRRLLFFAMERYERDMGAGYWVKDYGDGLL